MDYKKFIASMENDENPTVWKVVKWMSKAIIAVKFLTKKVDSLENQLEVYRVFYEDIATKDDCNTCQKKSCEYRPKPGETTRFNCPLWAGKKEE